jgi:hypothetical protein
MGPRCGQLALAERNVPALRVHFSLLIANWQRYALTPLLIVKDAPAVFTLPSKVKQAAKRKAEQCTALFMSLPFAFFGFVRGSFS